MKNLSFENILNSISDDKKTEINEAVLPNIFKNALNLLGREFKKDFESKISSILNKTIDAASEAELYNALKSTAMAQERKMIAQKIVERRFDELTNIFKNYDLTIGQQSINAGKEIELTLDVNPALLKDIRAEYKLEAARRGVPVQQTTQQATQQVVQQTTQQVVQDIASAITVGQVDQILRSELPNFSDVFRKTFYQYLKGVPYNEQVTLVRERAIAQISNLKTLDEMFEYVDKLLTDIRSKNVLNKTEDLNLEKLQLENRRHKTETDLLVKSGKGASVVKPMLIAFFVKILTIATVIGVGIYGVKWLYNKIIEPALPGGKQPQKGGYKGQKGKYN